MKNILGLDLGTNSIGWAVVKQYTENDKPVVKEVVDAGSRIIPMDMAAMSDFESGNLQSQTAIRTDFRGKRRLFERRILRRERLHRVLNILGFLPSHYAQQIDFDKSLGQFYPNVEPNIAFKKNTETGKYDFLFLDSFNEMLSDFRLHQPHLKKISYDWTLYYLRDKAIKEKVSKEELAWILLNFNQKRGYYQQRGEDEPLDQVIEYDELTVLKVVDTGDVKNGSTWFEVHLSDGGIYKKTSKIPLDWEGKTKEFIITTKIDKDGQEVRSYSIPNKENDWTLIKKRTEKYITTSKLTVGSYIYQTLLEKPDTKIRGGLIQTIERDNYKSELIKILQKQKEFHAELNDETLYKQCINELYRSNEAYRCSISNKDFVYLFLYDIIFFHRPLKSKKSLIDICPYEKRFYVDKETKQVVEVGVKCIHRSHPLFEEFRIWQLIQNLKIIDLIGSDVTSQYITNEDDEVELFEKLRNRKEINQKEFLRLYGLKEEQTKWNYGDTVLTLCPIRYEMISKLRKLNLGRELSDKELICLWHVLYSVTDKYELTQALKTFSISLKLNNIDAFVDEFAKTKPFENNYGAYSEKAIRRLLSLMRKGKYWKSEAIDANTMMRLHAIIDGEVNIKVNDRTREQLVGCKSIDDFSGLKLHQACYAVYGRYAEAGSINRWEKPQDIDEFLKTFKQHSLRNPIVEQIIRESLCTVRDIWLKYEKIDEIHVELGRDIKNPKDKRKKISDQQRENEITNYRIKELLKELQADSLKVRPESPSDQQRLKLYEEGVLGATNDIPDEIQKILKQRLPSKSEITRYKCWLEQGYCSPYSGRMIPLSKLFTPAMK